MSDVVHLDERTVDLDVGKTGNGYSKVILNVTEELFYEAGDDSGDTLEVTCPWGTQAIADSILNSVQGYRYQPYGISQAMIDPSAELGDAVSVGSHDVYGGLYEQKTEFGKMCFASASAPSIEEAEGEYPYKAKQDRKVERRLATVESELKVQADEISAKVSETGGSDESFSWQLNKDAFVLKASNQEVMRVNSTGATIEGVITATSGKIGGFTIGNNKLFNGISSYNGNGTDGVYIGTDGIRLGDGVKIGSGGNIALKGTIYIWDGEKYKSISASSFNNSVSGGGSYHSNIGADGKYKSPPENFTTKKLYVDGKLSGADATFLGSVGCQSLTVGLNKIKFETITIDGSSKKVVTWTNIV